ncbi:LamG-like jellyroll fold domain-containing protein [Hyunsoonleella ulvae]|uniref:LamG-like jellyroll fold domain-containing protein n=1 Tax=Hyunsoonleella ulvae TaxID=2799948 RepID=UPI00193AB68F|nr:LamG-like jellyroll fold domain-containing protein [Hyunsoonleella ulvae]
MKLKLRLSVLLLTFCVVLGNAQKKTRENAAKASNHQLEDSDKDGIANIIDLDDDNDGISDVDESFGKNPDEDIDKDGTVNFKDPDFEALNNYGICKSLDRDNDGVPNHLDLDSDNDGILDNIEAQSSIGYKPPSAATNPETGICNNYNSGLKPIDTDGDGTYDYLDSDSDGDGTPDIEENGMANSISNSDKDFDGLDDVFEGNKKRDGYSIQDEIKNNILPDSDNDLSFNGDLDYRDLYDINPPEKAAIHFDGMDDYVSGKAILSKFNETNAKGITLMGWIKNDAEDESTVSSFLFGEDNALELKSVGSTLEVEGHFKTPFGRLHTVKFSRKYGLKKGIWRHVAVVIDFENDTADISIDGMWVHHQNLAYPGKQDIVGFYSEVTKTSEKFMMAKEHDASNVYYTGSMDEIRLFNTTLSDKEIKAIVFQEIKNENGVLKGTITPNQIGLVDWKDLQMYYPMTAIVDAKVEDKSNKSNTAIIHNMAALNPQTAPMPFVTKQDGYWYEKSTWLYGDEWAIPGDGTIDNMSNSDEDYKWGIYHVRNNVVLNKPLKLSEDANTVNDFKAMALIVDKKHYQNDEDLVFTIGDTKQSVQLKITSYLDLEGTLNLERNSLLIEADTKFNDVLAREDVTD